MTEIYGAEFFAYHEQLSRASARRIVPLVLELVPARSVVDVGGGIGIWLEEFATAGVSDYLGIDGAYVSLEQLRIPPAHFLAHELEQPLTLSRTFDLACSLEVAEHLPAEHAARFIESLVGLAPVVLFSAAIPHQGGQHHVNEQWPDYWHALFAEHDYVAVDTLRSVLWRCDDIAHWYAQNIVFYVARSRLPDYPRLAAVFAADGDVAPLRLVHPQHYLDTYENMKRSQCLALRATLKLREINLVVFPNWSLPADTLSGQLRSLCTALAVHPQQQQICTVIHLGADAQAAARLIESATRELSVPAGTPQPAVRGISPSFGADQWEVVAACCAGRVALAGDDPRTVESHHAGPLPAVTLEFLESGKALT